MFTGIVQEKAEIVAKEEKSGGAALEIGSRKLLPNFKPGDSVSVDGVCLTLSEKKEKSFTVEVTPETLRCTNLGERRSGDPVNLEPAARLSDFLGGHLVQGHVDQTGKVLSIRSEGNSKIFRIAAPEEVLSYCTLKGSITVNGVSLTISELNSECFEVTIIPYTLEVTNFRELGVGGRVNLEADIISKYVESHISKYIQTHAQRFLGKLGAALFLSSSLLFGNSFSLGPNSILVYENQTSEDKSQFVLRVARYRPDIFLEWESSSHQGTLHLYREAVKEGTSFSLNSLFEVGVDMESSRVMTVWLSERMYRELTLSGETKIKLNRLPLLMKLKGEGTYRLKLNKKVEEIPVIYVEDSRKGSWTFHKNPENPILVEYVFPYFRQSLKVVSTARTNKLRWIRKLPPVK